MRTEEYQRRRKELAGWAVVVETYKLGDTYHCAVSSVDPGARIARGDGSTREVAETQAVEKATRRLALTRRFASG